MKRLAENSLLEWFENENRMPLIIRGARQVGKSTLVKNFCKNNDIELIEINLEKLKVPALELDNIDLNRVLSDIEALTRKEFRSDIKQILFIDEIQAQPKALRSLRYFFEEMPEIPVIAAGSLLDFLLNDKKMDFPVGRVSYLKLGPMSFTEFLLAMGEELLVKKMKDPQKIQGSLHDELLKQVQNYFFVGGMPKAVLTFQKTKKLTAVRKIQKDLIESYKDDFIKYAKKEKIHLLVNTVFDFAPFNLGKKVKYSEIYSDVKALELRKAIELLSFARILIPVHHTNASGLPISSQKDNKIFKLFFLDVGLVSAATDLPFEDLNLKSLMDGPIAEQFVSQHLNYHFNTQIHEELFYWLKDKSSAKAEVDFVLQSGKLIIPLEVKSGSLLKMKSLHQFCVDKSSKIGVVVSENFFKAADFNFKIYDGCKNINHNAKLLQLPFYQIEHLKEILGKIDLAESKS